LLIPKRKSRIIDDSNITASTFIIPVEIIDIIEKHWSRIKKGNIYTIDNIIYNDFIQYQYATIKIINGIYWESEYIESNEVLRNLLAIKWQT
jgi:hypothetical protein